MTNPTNYGGGYPAPYGGFQPPVDAQKPSSVTTVAIFAIIMGSLGVLCCGFGGIVGSMMFGSTMIPGEPPVQQHPDVLAINTVFGVIDLLASGMLLACGIGALSLKPWLRKLGLVVAALIIAIAVAKFITALAYTGAKTEDYMKRVDQAVASAHQKQGGKTPPPPSFAQFASVATIGLGLLMLILQSVTPLLILLLWTKPHVKAAFAGQYTGTGYPMPGPGQYPNQPPG